MSPDRIRERLRLHAFRAAALAAACAAPASADVIAWDLNRAIPTTLDGLYIKVDTQQSTTSAGTGLSGWDINPYGSSSLNFYATSTAPNPASTYVRTQTSGGPSNLALGDLVGPSSTYVNSTTAVITSAGVGSNGWTLNAINYVGFRFHNNTTNTINYGYAAVQVGATVTARSVLRVAYENSGAAIEVGAEAGPYDPCSAGNPALAVGSNALGFNQLSASDLDPGCGLVLHKANVFRFTATTDGEYSFSTCAGTQDTRMALMSACQGGTTYACNDNCTGGSGSTIVRTLAANEVVFLAVGAASPSSSLASPTTIVVSPPPLLACATSQVLAFGDNAYDNAVATQNQTVKNSITNGTTTIYKGSWFRFVPTVTGDYTFSLCGSVNDTRIAIGTQCPGVGSRFESLAYNDDSCACASGCGSPTQSSFSSRLNSTNSGIPLNQPLNAGQTYYVLIGGYSATTQPTSGALVIDGPPQVPACPGDLDDDGSVNGVDLGIILGNWDTANPISDLNGDGATNGLDLGILLGGWGTCPA
jgi:hypothetical protein